MVQGINDAELVEEYTDFPKGGLGVKSLASQYFFFGQTHPPWHRELVYSDWVVPNCSSFSRSLPLSLIVIVIIRIGGMI